MKLKQMNLKNQKICIIGLGYIGLPTAALLSNRGYDVHGVDIDPNTVDTINRGEIHIVEPELDTFVKAAVNSGKLKAALKPCQADIFILAVPTPFHEGYVPNIDYIISATKAIAPFIQEDNIVILESTSPVGTTDKVEQILKEERPDLFKTKNRPERSALGVQNSSLHIAHCPERVLPGQIMRELVENDRIVGGTTPQATKETVEFYKTFVSGEILSTDARTAEMAKLTENSFRDTNIAFANELSILCDKFDIDVWELIKLTNRHPRVNVLKPGAGVGGHCIAVDPWFIVHAGGDDAKIIKTAREINTYKTEWVIEKIKNAVNEWKLNNSNTNTNTQNSSLQPKVAIMGLAFKPDIDDLRESPALYIAKRLTDELENVVCVEPNIALDSELKTQNSMLKLENIEDTQVSSNILVFLVAHKEFKLQATNNTQTPAKLDFCGILN